MKYALTRLVGFVISLRLTVACLLLFMVVVFWGTVYQKAHGLHAAQEAFYYAWLTPPIGFVPLPGGLTLLWILFVNLLASMIVQFRYGWRHVGVVLTHFGLLMLLAGGWVTHQFGQEAFLSLREGELSNLASDYQAWEISVWTNAGPDRVVTAWDLSALQAGTILETDDPPLSLRVESLYENARAFTGEAGPDVTGWINRSGIQRFEAAARERDPENHLPGVVLVVEDAEEDPARLALYAGENGPTLLPRKEGEAGECYLHLRRKRYPLPVAVRLEDFQRAYHPNSDIPKSFSSRITAFMHDMEREVLIEMNRPFRYMGFTFFQASFTASASGPEISQFAVTDNRGRLVPYVATGVTVLGLAVHFIVALLSRHSRRGEST